MPDSIFRRQTAFPRDQAFWLAASVLVLGQLLAFWMLCAHQVRKAEVRHASVQVERFALADCLRHVPNATLSGCAARVAPLDRQAQALAAGGAPADPSVVPVNSVYR